VETASTKETDSGNGASSDPALTPYVTATAAEIAYAEKLRRQIEQRYLNPLMQRGRYSYVGAD
jgi:hypothetical protein